jgi:hypothetical protein
MVSQDLLSLLRETGEFLWKDWPIDMHATLIDLNSRRFTMSGVCPHPACNRPSVFMPVTNVYVDVSMWVAGMQCQGCFKYLLACVRQLQGTDGRPYIRYETHYPVGSPNDTVAPEIPEHIQPDFKEALRCLWVDAYNATAEMCRRALEASCLDLKAPPNKVLEKMIDWLADNRKITPDLQAAAHKVRLGGNRGAHPSPAAEKTDEVIPAAEPNQIAAAEDAYEGPIEKIEKEHAEAIVAFTQHFFQYVYVIPKRLDKYDFSKPKA